MTESNAPADYMDDEPDTEDIGTYYVAVEHEGLPGFIYRAETNGGFLPANEDVGFGLVSPLDAEWSAPSYYCEEQLIDETLARWAERASSHCGCEVRRLNVIANGGDQGQAFECQPAPVLKMLTLIRPDGERIVIYDAEAKGDA